MENGHVNIRSLVSEQDREHIGSGLGGFRRSDPDSSPSVGQQKPPVARKQAGGFWGDDKGTPIATDPIGADMPLAVHLGR